MPSSYLYYKDTKTSNKIAWYILITVLIVTLIGFLYSKFFSNADAFYEKTFYEKISGIHVPSSSTVLESFDNGEFWTATSFKVNKDSLSQFIIKFNFHSTDSGAYKPKMFAETLFKVEKLDRSPTKYVYSSGTKGKHNWLYVVDTERSILWAEIQYPDWSGN